MRADRSSYFITIYKIDRLHDGRKGKQKRKQKQKRKKKERKPKMKTEKYSYSQAL